MFEILIALALKVDRLKRTTKQRFYKMTVELEELRAAVAANEEATAAAISRLTSLAELLDEMAAAQVSGADLSALAQQIRDDNAELLAAATLPSPPEPVPEPTPEPAPDA